MVVKKSGKVEHSDNSHDDQVFSYLMALYVWYDGKNLAENFRIIKNTIKTDTEEELLENDIEDNIENIETVEMDGLGYTDVNDDILEALDFVEANSKYITTEDLYNQQYLENVKFRTQIFNKNQQLREKLAQETGVDADTFKDMNHFGQTDVTLPESLFIDDISDMDFDEYGNPIENYSVLQGNLSSYWNQV
jgi:hypothetical protein